MEQAADEDEEPPADATAADAGEDFLLTDTADDLDLRLARLEHLMERRPELLSSVMLRQNPHNVHEWHKRAKLFQANPTKQIICYTGAWVLWCGCGEPEISALLLMMMMMVVVMVVSQCWRIQQLALHLSTLMDSSLTLLNPSLPRPFRLPASPAPRLPPACCRGCQDG